MKYCIIRIWALMLVGVVSSATLAQEPLCTLAEKATELQSQGGTVDGQFMQLFLHEMQTDSCFTSSCSEPLCQLLDDFEQLSDQQDKIVGGVLLTREMRNIVAALTGGQSGWLENYQRNFTQATNAFLMGDIPELKAAELQPSGIKLFPRHNDTLTEIDLASVIGNACSSASPLSDTNCQETFSQAQQALKLQTQQHRVFNELFENNRKATQTYLDALDARWDTYNNHAAALYPWERYLNARLFEKSIKTSGFIEPPQRQLIALHPTVTVEFDSDAEKNFEEALTVELIGFHRWSYESKWRQFGASIIASYNQSDDDVGYGILLRLPQNWAIGVVDRDGGTATVLSVDLAKFLTDNTTVRSAFNNILNH